MYWPLITSFGARFIAWRKSDLILIETSMSETIIAIENLSKSFKKASSQDLLVLEDVNFKLQEGEIVALLGKSGRENQLCCGLLQGLLLHRAER